MKLVPCLTSVCFLNALCCLLGDLGAVPAEFFLPVLSHCSPEELQRIEDLTMYSSVNNTVLLWVLKEEVRS